MLPCVKQLDGVCFFGDPVFDAFPGLEIVQCSAALACTELQSLTKHCTRLKELKFDGDTDMLPFMNEDPCDSVAALQSLGALHCLERLSFTVGYGLELFALVGAAKKLLAHNLCELTVYVPQKQRAWELVLSYTLGGCVVCGGCCCKSTVVKWPGL